MVRLLAGIALLSSSAAAQAPAPPTAPAAAPEIIVEGRKLDGHDVATAVRSISNPESTGGEEWQYPRWAEQICVLVGGFPRDGGQFIADRIGQVARDLKLDAGQPGCSPNIFILSTGDPSKLIAGLRLKRRGLVSGKDIAVVRHIQRSQDAVRWIGATAISNSTGEAPQTSAYGMAGTPAPQYNNNDGGSRLVARTATTLTRETIIVDSHQIVGLSYTQLSDYLAFVALAQLNPHASPPGVDSILSLFPRGSSAPAGLTKFDRAYLDGLYRSTANAVGALQKDTIEDTVDRALRPKSPPTTNTVPGK